MFVLKIALWEALDDGEISASCRVWGCFVAPTIICDVKQLAAAPAAARREAKRKSSTATKLWWRGERSCRDWEGLID